jgi:hypothetical protein
VELVLFLHRGDGCAGHIDFREIELPDADLAAIVEIADPVRIDAHHFEAHAIGGEEISGGNGHTRFDRSALRRPVALHALVSVEHRDAEERLHFLRRHQHVVVRLAQPHVIFPLVVPLCRARRAPERRTQNHVFDRHGSDHGVVGLQHGRADHVRIGIDQRSSQPRHDRVQVVVEQLHHVVFAGAIEIHKAYLLRAAFLGKLVVLEILEGIECIFGR